MGRIRRSGFSSRGRIRTGGTVSSSQKQTVRRSQTRKSGPQITSAKRSRIVSSSIRPKIRSVTTIRKISSRKFPLRTNKIINKSRDRARKSNRIILNRRRSSISKPTRTQPPLQKAEFKVTQFGGGSAINNVFDLIQQTSQRSAERKAILKAEGRLPAQQPRREPIINIDKLFGGFL